MAQDGHHAGHQGADASDVNGIPPSEIVTNPPSSRDSNNNQGTLTPVDIAPAADAGDEKDVVPSVGGEEGAGLATGEAAAGADVVAAEDDATKGKGKAVAVDDEVPPQFMVERERRMRMNEKFAKLSALLPKSTKKITKAAMVDVAIDHIRHLEATLQKLQKRKRELLLAKSMQTAAADLGAGSSSARPPYAGQVPVLPQGFWIGSSSAPPPDAGQVLVLPESWGWVPKKKAAAARPAIGFQSWSESDIVLNVTGDHAFVTVCTAQRPGVLLLVLSVLQRHHIEVISAQISNVNRTVFNLHTRVNLEAISQLGAEVPSSEAIYHLAVSEIVVWLSG